MHRGRDSRTWDSRLVGSHHWPIYKTDNYSEWCNLWGIKRSSLPLNTTTDEVPYHNVDVIFLDSRINAAESTAEIQSLIWWVDKCADNVAMGKPSAAAAAERCRLPSEPRVAFWEHHYSSSSLFVCMRLRENINTEMYQLHRHCVA